MTVSRLGDGLDTRDIHAELLWNADGSVSGVVQETLKGAVAALIRQYLATTPAAEREALLADLAGSAFPGLKLSWLEATGTEAESGPLLVRYGVAGQPNAQRETALDLGLNPAELGKTYAGLPQRRTALPLGYATALNVQMKMYSPEKPILPVGSLKAHHRLLQTERKASPLPDGLQLDYRLAVTPGVTAPDDYPAAAEALRAVDAAEQVRLSR